MHKLGIETNHIRYTYIMIEMLSSATRPQRLWQRFLHQSKPHSDIGSESRRRSSAGFLSRSRRWARIEHPWGVEPRYTSYVRVLRIEICNNAQKILNHDWGTKGAAGSSSSSSHSSQLAIKPVSKAFPAPCGQFPVLGLFKLA